MKTRAALFLGAVWMALATANVYAQAYNTSSGKAVEGNFMRVTGGFQGGADVAITTFAVRSDGTREPGDVIGGIAVIAKQQVFHRHIETSNACYGYDLTIEPPKDPDRPRFRVTFRPLDPEWQKQENERILTYNKKACTLVSLAELPEPQMVSDEDTISLEILSDPQTGVKIVDAIRVGWHKDNAHQPKAGKQ
jgi:hypothetical protein